MILNVNCNFSKYIFRLHAFPPSASYFFSLPHQITLKFDISRNKFPFTLNNSFLFCQQSRVKGKKEMFSLCKSFNSFFILSCLLSQLLAVAYIWVFFCWCYVVTFKSNICEKKKKLLTKILNFVPVSLRDMCLHKNHIKLHEWTMPFLFHLHAFAKRNGVSENCYINMILI